MVFYWVFLILFLKQKVKFEVEQISLKIKNKQFNKLIINQKKKIK
jgi:hypothetical protein